VVTQPKTPRLYKPIHVVQPERAGKVVGNAVGVEGEGVGREHERGNSRGEEGGASVGCSGMVEGSIAARARQTTSQARR